MPARLLAQAGGLIWRIANKYNANNFLNIFSLLKLIMFGFLTNKRGGALIGLLIAMVVIAALYWGSSFFWPGKITDDINLNTNSINIIDTYQEAAGDIDEINKNTQKRNEAINDDLRSGVMAKDWQTYRNEEYGFEIEYPSLYNLIDNIESGIYEKDVLYRFKFGSGNDGELIITIQDKKFDIDNVTAAGGHRIYKDKISRVIIANRDAFKYNANCREAMCTQVDMPADNKIIELLFIDYPLSQTGRIEKYQKKILQTFKFIN